VLSGLNCSTQAQHGINGKKVSFATALFLLRTNLTLESGMDSLKTHFYRYRYKALTAAAAVPKIKQAAGAMPQTIAYLVLLWLGYGLVGWLLSAYRVPTSVWIGTLMMTFYLAWAGLDAIALASIWVVGVLSIGAIRHAWMWQIVRPYYQIEPLVLLIIWLLSLGLVVFTAIAHKQLQKRFNRAQVLYRLISSAWFGLALGLWVYYRFTFPLLTRSLT
jgi:hypothetical protein